SSEFAPASAYPVIDLLPAQKDVAGLGGTMRLGLYPCRLEAGTFAAKAYELPLVYERHRHRYELNNLFRDRLAQSGMRMSGVSPDDSLVEIIELPEHPWFVGTQFHPEFKSRPNRAHPLFRDFIAAALVLQRSKRE
ncbi:MAG TPA: C26 family cysteine hydrolase domain-containing family, partial [Firmicutes bacterium]|nr:C26 family cysteine hydrolase domain-containing family [Bacillota bacterium]